MIKVKHLLLDLGGVVIEDNDAAPLALIKNGSKKAILKALIEKEMLVDRGLVTFGDYVSLFNTIAGTNYSVKEYQKVKHQIIKFNWKLINYCKRYRKHFKTSILSDNNRSNVQYYNRHIGLNQWTYQQAYSYHYKITKPNPKIFKILLKKIKAKPSECLFIDDHYENVIAARKLGMVAEQYKNNTELFKILSRAFLLPK